MDAVVGLLSARATAAVARRDHVPDHHCADSRRDYFPAETHG
jgi:hypothetical protein